MMEKPPLPLSLHLKDAGGLDRNECFVDGTFVPATKGDAELEKLSVASACSDVREGLPIGNILRAESFKHQ
jgi:hypothetical protein